MPSAAMWVWFCWKGNWRQTAKIVRREEAFGEESAASGLDLRAEATCQNTLSTKFPSVEL
jgi:hypothetical protein